MATAVNGSVLAAVLASGVHFEPEGDLPMGDCLVRRIRFSGDGSKRAPESYATSTPQPCPAAALHAPPSPLPRHSTRELRRAAIITVIRDPAVFLPWNMDDLLHELVLVAEAEEEDDDEAEEEDEEEMFADHLDELAAAEGVGRASPDH